MFRRASQTYLGALLVMMLGACSDPELILSGERVSILPQQSFVTVDDSARAEGASLGPATVNQLYGHPGVSAGHDGGHLSLQWPIAPVWSASVEGIDDITVELTAPVIAHDHVYVLGADGQLHAFDAASGAPHWAVMVEALTDDPWAGIAGGIAVNDTHLLAHASNYNLVSLDPKTGDILWTISHAERLKGGPTLLSDEAVMVTDINGRLYLYALDSGMPLWERSGQSPDTIVFGAPAPAFAGSEVVIAGAGGELSVYDAATGDLFWADSLASFNPRTPLQELGDIRAHPVHDGKLIFVVSQSGRMVAYQAGTGIDIWEQPLTSIELPWLAGDTLYVVTIDGRLYSLRRGDGQARWVAELPGALAEGEIASDAVLRYTNPILASDTVFVISRAGTLYMFDAQTGDSKGEISTPGQVTTSPAIAQDLLVVVNRQGKVSAYR